MNWELEKTLKVFVLCCSFRAGHQKQKTGHTAKTTTCIYCGKPERDPIHSTTMRNAVKAFNQMEKDRDKFRYMFEDVCEEIRALRDAMEGAMPTLEQFANGRPQLHPHVKAFKEALKVISRHSKKKLWRR